MSVSLLLALNAQAEEIKREHAEVLAPAAKDKRALSTEEIAKADELQAKLDRVIATRKHEQARIEGERAEAVTEPEAKPDATDRVAKAHAEERRILGFGKFLQDVATFAKDGSIGPTIKAAASGLNTSVPSEGGFLVRTDFSTMLLDRGMTEAVLAPKCTTINIGADADGLEAPYIDETSRVTGSRFGGVRVYRAAEADTVTASKPKFGRFEIRLEDLNAICYATERSLRDAQSLGEVINKAFASEFAYTIDDEILTGDGVGKCLGILSSDATVSVAKEGSQVAATVVAENVMKMHARMPAKLRSGAEWFYNQDVETQFPQLHIKVKNVAGNENVGGLPMWAPPNVLAPYHALYGKPGTPVEQCKTLGTVGDFLFLNLKEYLLIKKGGLEIADSIHVRFLYNEKTFRFTYRINGAPSWKSALTPANGSATLSPFISLATRS
jgi:HK97 family phage major capsid protein